MKATLFKSAIFGTFLLAFALGLYGYAQSEPELFTAKNTVFVEGGGNAGKYVANYGRTLHQKGMFKLSGSAGFDVVSHGRYIDIVASCFSIRDSALLGKSKHHLEIGAGITPYLRPTITSSPGLNSCDSNHLSSFLPFRLGNRYQKPKVDYSLGWPILRFSGFL